MSCDAGEAWLVDLRDIAASTPALLDALHAGEAARAGKFVIEARQRDFAASRLVLRALAGVTAQGLATSWSRSEGRLAFSRAQVPAIGIDVEILRPLAFSSMLPVICKAGERARLGHVARLDEPESFFRIWTAKEAIMKAMGEGFQAGVKSVVLTPEILGLGEDETACIPVADRIFTLRTWSRGDARMTLATAD